MEIKHVGQVMSWSVVGVITSEDQVLAFSWCGPAQESID